MKTKILLTTVSSFFILHSAFAQGALTPPGAPAPTMKTLDQLEPRTPISQAGISLGAGSYYLTGNLTATGNINGIIVTANDVTIDLNGFEIIGSGAAATGIFLNSGIANITIRNGTIRSWGSDGINGVGNPRVRVENVRVFGNGLDGIAVDVNAVVKDCIAQGNSGSGIKGTDNCLIENCQAIASTNALSGHGIVVGDACILTRCVARGNPGIGISVGSGTTLANCVASTNRGDAGIHTGSRCTLLGCTADANTGALATSAGILTGDSCLVSHCSVTGSQTTAVKSISTGMGISVPQFCSVEHCSVTACIGDGIRAANDCTITDNTSDENGFLGSISAGIHTTSDHNRIEANSVNGNRDGIVVDGTDSLILKNSASRNLGGFVIAASNRYGAIVLISSGVTAAVNGGAAANTLTTSDPWANFSY